jgi:tetratricopeptide (TPR) repeat protein
MTLPNWIKNKTWQWVIGIFVAILAIIVPLIFLSSPPGNQSLDINGTDNTAVQFSHSPGASININEIDPEKLAIELVKNMPDYQTLKEKDTEIQALKATIERLQLEPGDELKRDALQALSEGNTKKAISLLEKSAQLCTEKAKQFSKKAAQDWVDIGNIAFLNNSLKALNAYQNATRLDPSSLVAWNRLGHILSRLGRLEEAKHACEQVLELAEKDVSSQASAYGNLGIIYRTRGKLDKAEEFCRKSLDIDKALGQQEGMAAAYVNLGNIYQSRGKLDKAEEFYRKSLDINKALGQQEGMASAYGNLGIIYRTRGKLDKAEEFCRKSLDINKALGRQKGMASAYGNLGVIYQSRGKLDKAEEFYRKSLDINKALGQQKDMAIVYNNLGIIYRTRGKLDKAEEFCRKSLDINKALGRQKGMANAYFNLGIIYRTRGKLDKAYAYWQKSLELFSNIGAKSQSNIAGGLIIENCNTN